MKLRSAINALSKQKQFSIWKHTSSPTKIETIYYDIDSYVNETQKKDVDTEKAMDNTHPNWLRDGVDYLSTNSMGKVCVHGFLRDDLTRLTGKPYIALNNNEIGENVKKAWHKRYNEKNIKRVGHKFVLSLNPKLCGVLNKCGYSADEVLGNSIKKCMHEFNKQFYPDAQIGYIYGVHHDTDNLHAHIILFPTTHTGKLLRISDESMSQGKKQLFKFLRDTSHQYVANFFKYHIQEPVLASFGKNKYKVQNQLLSSYIDHLANKEFEQVNFHPLSRVEWVKNKTEEVLKLPEDDLRKTLTQAYQYAQDVYKALNKKFRESPADLDNALKRNKEKISELQVEFNKSRQELEQLKADKLKERKACSSLYKELSNWQHFKFNYTNIISGGITPRDKEVHQWLNNIMSSNSTSAVKIKEWIEEKQKTKEFNEDQRRVVQGLISTDDLLFSTRFEATDPLMKKALAFNSSAGEKQLFYQLEQMLNMGAFNDTFCSDDLARDYLTRALKASKESQEELDKQIKLKQSQLQAFRTSLDARKIEGNLIQSLKYTRNPPEFLKDFEGWKLQNIPIPLDELMESPKVQWLRGSKLEKQANAIRPENTDTWIKDVTSMLSKLRRNTINIGSRIALNTGGNINVGVSRHLNEIPEQPIQEIRHHIHLQKYLSHQKSVNNVQKADMEPLDKKYNNLQNTVKDILSNDYEMAI